MRRQVIIDLTALLDVILILLFMVLVGATNRVERVQAEAGALESENTALREQVDELDRQAFTRGLLDEKCRVITLSVARSEDGTRRLKLSGDDFRREYILTWDNAATIRAAAAAELIKLCPAEGDEYAVMFLAFRFDRGDIYESDYRFVTGLTAQVKSGRDNVYSLEYDSKEDDYEQS